MRYIIIIEDGTIYASGTISDDDKKMCNNGYISIIDTQTFKEYDREHWTDVFEWEGADA